MVGDKKTKSRISPELRETIGKNIDTLLEMHGMTKEELAKLLQYKESSGFFSEVTKGKKTPSFPMIRKIEDHFGLLPGALMENRKYTTKEFEVMKIMRSLVVDSNEDDLTILKKVLGILTDKDRSPYYEILKAIPEKPAE